MQDQHPEERLYAGRERSIFGPYFDGARTRHGDPLRIYRRLVYALGRDPNRWLERYDDLGDDDANEKVVQAAGWALEMVPFDPETGRGATESHIEVALRAFREWLEKNALQAVTSRTWLPPTVPESCREDSTTSPGSSSSSISPDSSPVA